MSVGEQRRGGLLVGVFGFGFDLDWAVFVLECSVSVGGSVLEFEFGGDLFAFEMLEMRNMRHFTLGVVGRSVGD